MTSAETLETEGQPQVEQHWHTAWDAALQAVELDVEEAERLLVRMHAGEEPEVAPLGDWIAPALLGPMPVEFADRARALLRRQSDVTELLAEAMVSARSQTRGLSKFDAPERRPVFVDTAL
jgi:hypothetical protein